MKPPEYNPKLSGSGDNHRQMDRELIADLKAEPDIAENQPSTEAPITEAPINVRPWLEIVPTPTLDEDARPQGESAKVIDLVKHFRAKQIRNYRRPSRAPGALVLLNVFHPDQPA